jgi:hypothetical protein
MFSYRLDYSAKNKLKKTASSTMEKLYRKRLFIFVLLIPLAGCDTPNLENSLPELTFKHQNIIQLDVERIEIINEFKMPFKFPNVEHLVPISPGASAERWASDILRPIGKSGIAQFVITNGSVIREDLKIQKGIKGIFSLDQSKRFQANVNVRLEIFKDQKKSVAQASASRSQTLREDASPNLQSRLWYNLVERLMESFNRQMRNQINTHLRIFIS